MNPTSPTLPSHAAWHRHTASVLLPTGIRMAYMEAGAVDAPTLLLIHGFSDSSRVWRLAISALQAHFHIYAVDLRGFGQSDKPAQCVYSMPQHAEDVLAFMDVQGIDSAYVMAHSMGTMIAQTIAFTAPDRVKKLVLAATMTHMRETPEDVAQVRDLYTSMDVQALSELELQQTFLPHPESCCDKAFPAGYLSTLRCLNGKGLAAAWYGMSLTDNRNFFQFITAPVLVLWGTEDDIFTEAYQDEVKAYLPQATFVALDGVSHEIPTSVPYDMAAYAQQFFLQ